MEHRSHDAGAGDEERSTGGAIAHRATAHDLEVEEHLLGAMLLNSDAISVALETCRPEDFSVPTLGALFAAIARLSARGEPVDVVTVTDELRRTSDPDLVFDPSDLISMQGSTPSSSNAAQYAEIVAAHAQVRASVISPGDDGPVDDSSTYPRDFPGIET